MAKLQNAHKVLYRHFKKSLCGWYTWVHGVKFQSTILSY